MTDSPNGNLLLTPPVVGDGCKMWGGGGRACVGDGSIYWLINRYTFGLINANELLSHVADEEEFLFVSSFTSNVLVRPSLSI